MSELKRDEIKYIRDISKSAYEKASNCFICNEDDLLEFHHFCSMTPLWTKWKKSKKIVIKTIDDILEHRISFVEDHYNEIYNETITLCKPHHMKLHKIYGKNPTLATSEKQKRWVNIQRDKLNKE